MIFSIEGESAAYDEEANKEYWKQYYEYYYGRQQPEAESKEGEQKEATSDAKKAKKAKKRKAEQNQGMSQKWTLDMR